MTLRLQLLILILLASALAMGWWSYDSWGGDGKKTKAARRSSTPLVLVEAVTFANDRVTLRFVGTGKAARSAALHTTAAGVVREIAFKAEQRVRKGQALIRLDDDRQRLEVRLEEVAVAETARQLRRMEKLAPSGYAAGARLDSARAAVETAQLDMQRAQVELRDRTLFAPFAGVVGMTELEPGDRVTEDIMAVTLDDRSAIIVQFSVPENHAGRVKLGDGVGVRPWAAPDRRITGKITAMASRIDPATRSLPMQATIDNPGDRLRPGGSFEVRLTLSGQPYPVIREVAVSWSRDGAYLWRIAAGRAEKVFITMVRRRKGRILVNGPLAPGDLIVVEGVQGLRPGKAVRTAPFKSGAGAGVGTGPGADPDLVPATRGTAS